MNILRLAKLKLVLGEVSEYTDIQKDILTLFKDNTTIIDTFEWDNLKKFNFYINISTKTVFYNETTVFDYISKTHMLKRNKFEEHLNTLLILVNLNKYMLIPIKID